MVWFTDSWPSTRNDWVFCGVPFTRTVVSPPKIAPGIKLVAAMGLRTPLFDAKEEPIPSTGNAFSETARGRFVPSSLTVYDGDAKGDVAPLRTISGPLSQIDWPMGVAVDRQDGVIYAIGDDIRGNPFVAVISGTTNTVTATISEPAGSIPAAIAVDPATGTVYAVNRLGTVCVIDGTTGKITRAIGLGPGAWLSQAAADASTDTMYISGGTTLNGVRIDALWPIDGATGTVGTVIDLGPNENTNGAAGVAVDEETDTVYATVPSLDEVQVVDAKTSTVGATISNVGEVVKADVDSSAGVLYATGPTGAITGTTFVIDIATDKVVASLVRGGLAVVADPATGKAYIPSGNRFDDVWVLTASATTVMSPIIVSGPPATFRTGVSGTYALSASALPAATFSETGKLPAGLTLSSQGVISGAPHAGTGGTYEITVTAANGIAPADTESFFLKVDQPPVITSPPRATFTVGSRGVFDLIANGYPESVFTAVGTLPGFLHLTSAGELYGMPPVGSAGIHKFKVMAQNGTAPAYVQAFTLTVDKRPAITSASHATFRAGVRNKFTVTSTGYPAATITEFGRMPMGVTFTAHANGTATISGTPKRRAIGRHFVIVITARNKAGKVKQDFTLRIR